MVFEKLTFSKAEELILKDAPSNMHLWNFPPERPSREASWKEQS
jgi:hypothetical protein